MCIVPVVLAGVLVTQAGVLVQLSVIVIVLLDGEQ